MLEKRTQNSPLEKKSAAKKNKKRAEKGHAEKSPLGKKSLWKFKKTTRGTPFFSDPKNRCP